MEDASEGKLRLGVTAIDQLMPLFIWITPTGHISAAGRTVKKMLGGRAVEGARFLELFEVKRPRNIEKFNDLNEFQHCPLRVAFRDNDRHAMKGQFVRLPENGGAIVNLSLGVSVIDAVGRHKLSGADFAASDPTVDMLYLIEAKTLALNESKRLNARLHGQKSEAEENALSDTLTGLKNRRAMERLLLRLQDDPVPFGLMHLDLDHFKQVNDTIGHAAGDHVLQHVASVLRDETRIHDMAARMGGDEFILILPGRVDLKVLGQIADRIITRLEEPISYEGEICKISGSIGITASTLYDPLDVKQMFDDADAALYSSKNRGRSCHTIFQPDPSALEGPSDPLRVGQ